MTETVHTDTLRVPGMDKPRGQRRTNAGKLELQDAYAKFFATPEGQMILVDLAAFSKFYTPGGPHDAADERAYCDGSRSVFGRVLSFVHMTDETKGALLRATRDYATTNEIEGEF